LRDELRPVFDTCLISLNDEYIEREQEIQLKQGDEISILPPISAG
jgi:molybdopterin converting factor small subunit